MKKLVALPLIVAMGLAVTACAKQADTDNADANLVTSDEAITDNEAAASDFATDNGLALDNSAGTDATIDGNAADANATEGNAL